MNSNPPIPGHELLAEGHNLGYSELVDRWIGGCRCGAQPPDWPVGSNATKRWHREHKAELRSLDHPHNTTQGEHG